MARPTEHNPDNPVRALARLLYEEMEFLGPSSPEPLTDWDHLTEWQHSLYVNCVERLLEEGELIDRARQLANDDVVARASHKRE